MKGLSLTKQLFSSYEHTCLELFADTIIQCNHFGAHKWGVVMAANDHMRVLMGSLVVASVEEGCFWLEIDVPDEIERKTLGTYINLRLTERYSYKRPVGQSAYYWPMKNHEHDWPNIQRLQRRYLAQVADTYDHLRIDSQNHSMVDLLAAIEEQLGVLLPRPDYRISIHQ